MVDDRCSSGCAHAAQVSKLPTGDLKSQRSWYKSPPAKLAAIGFILLILMGNVWFSGTMTGGVAAPWVKHGLASGVVLVIIGSIGSVIFEVIRIIY